jgi:hypothetical protein
VPGSLKEVLAPIHHITGSVQCIKNRLPAFALYRETLRKLVCLSAVYRKVGSVFALSRMNATMSDLSQILEVTTNFVIRPEDGLVYTSSGRGIPEPPWILPDEPESLVEYDRWLVRQARDEAAELRDELILAKVAVLDTPPLDTEARALLSHFLFGLPNPQFEAKPIAPPTPKEQAEAQEHGSFKD